MASPASTETRFWRADDLGADLLRGRFHDFSYDVHTHDTACFALLTAGAIRIRMPGMEFVARAGDLYAIGADEPHAGWPVDEQGWQLRTLYVDLDHLRSLIGDERPSRGAAIKGPIIRDRLLSALLRAVHQGSQEDGPALLRQQLYLDFAARLMHRHAADGHVAREPGKEHRAVAMTRDYLEERLDQRVRLDEVAGVSGLPVYRLYRAFRRDTGMSPHEFQRQSRVRRAMRLMRLGRPLSEVAADCGFTDQAHLNRSFRRIMGFTPGVYRSAVSA